MCVVQITSRVVCFTLRVLLAHIFNIFIAGFCSCLFRNCVWCATVILFTCSSRLGQFSIVEAVERSRCRFSVCGATHRAVKI